MSWSQAVKFPFEGLHVTPIEGLEQIKTASITIENTLPDYAYLEGVTVRIAVTSGLAGADVLMDELATGASPYHFIEVMGCPGGCINGRRPAPLPGGGVSGKARQGALLRG